MKNTLFVMATVIVILVILLLNTCASLRGTKTELAIEKSRGDTIIQTYNKLNQQVTTSYKMTGDLKAVLAGLEDQVKELKSKVGSSGSSVTYFSTFTPLRFTSKPFVIRDTQFGKDIYVDSLNKHYGDWITGWMAMSEDTSILELNIKNDFIVALGYEKRNLFKRDIAFASITNLNPYTKTTDLKVYKVALPKPKRFGLGIGIYGVVTSDFHFSPAIGAGLQYNLIRF